MALKRVKVPKDEVQDHQDREFAAWTNKMARQQLVWAHERTEAAMDADHHEEADSYSMSVIAWMDRLTGR